MFNTELLISVPQTHSSSNVCSSGNDTSIHLVACSVQNPLCHSWFVSSHTQLPIHQQILLELLWNYIVNQSSSHYLHCCCPSRGTIISCLDNCSRFQTGLSACMLALLQSVLPAGTRVILLLHKSDYVNQLSKDFSLIQNPYHGVPVMNAG